MVLAIPQALSLPLACGTTPKGTPIHQMKIAHILLLGSLEALLLAGEEGVYGSVELRAALEEVELHHEEETDEVTAELADERASCGCGAT